MPLQSSALIVGSHALRSKLITLEQIENLAFPDHLHHHMEVSLPDEIFTVVSAFLTPREMLSLAFTRKSMAEYCLSYENMVHNATKTDLVDLRVFLRRGLQERAIYMPSKHRLLRLLNATRCEFCFRPWTLSGTVPAHGLHMCSQCEMNTLLVRTPPNLLLRRGVKEIVHTEHRVIRGSFNEHQLIQSTLRTKSNESFGPILSVEAIIYICENEITVDEYLLEEGHRHGAEHKNVIPDPQVAAELMEALRRGRETLNQSATPCLEDRSRAYAILAPILDLVDDKWKPYTNFGFAPGKSDPIFKYSIVAASLKRLFQSPILMSESSSHCIAFEHMLESQDAAFFANEINNAFKRLWDKGFFLLDFNDDEQITIGALLFNRSKPLEAFIQDFLRRHVTSMGSIFQSRYFQQNFQQRGESSALSRDACFRLLLLSVFWESPLLVTMKEKMSFMPPRLLDLVADLVVSASSNILLIEEFGHGRCLSFARRVCRHIYWRQLHLDDDKERRGFRSYRDICNVFYAKSQSSFDILLPLVASYVTNTLTREFIREEQPCPIRVGATAWIDAKESAVNQIWSRKSAGTLQQIENKQYDALRQLHFELAKGIVKVCSG